MKGTMVPSFGLLVAFVVACALCVADRLELVGEAIAQVLAAF